MITKLANYVIRPRRGNYDPKKDLGPPLFFIDSLPCSRTDFYVTNDRNQILHGSIYYRSLNPFPYKGKYACIIYCHGNCGDRTDSFESLKPMLSMDICVVCFDFAGCGRSEGDYVTLGLNESKDIQCIVDYIRKELQFVNPDRIGLWGRSMGAVSAILYASRRNDVKCMVLDSPFSDLPTLIQEFIKKYKVIAKLAGNYLLKKVKDKIASTTGLKVDELKPIDHIGDVQCPVLFIHSTKDQLINFNHSKELFEKAKCEKQFHEITVGHNDVRPADIYEGIKYFVSDKLRVSQREVVLKEARRSPSNLSNVKQNENENGTPKNRDIQQVVNNPTPKRNLVPQLENIQSIQTKNSPTNLLKAHLSPSKKDPEVPRNRTKNEAYMEYFSEVVEAEASGNNNEGLQKRTPKNKDATVRATSLNSSRRVSLGAGSEKEIPATARGEKPKERDSSLNPLPTEQDSGIGESTTSIKESEKFNILVQTVKPRGEPKNKIRIKAPSIDQTEIKRNNFRIQTSMRSTASSSQRSQDEYQLKELKNVLKNPVSSNRSLSKETTASASVRLRTKKSFDTSYSMTENTLLHLPNIPKIHESDLKRIMEPTLGNSNRARLSNTMRLILDKNRVFSNIPPAQTRKERAIVSFKIKFENKKPSVA